MVLNFNKKCKNNSFLKSSGGRPWQIRVRLFVLKLAGALCGSPANIAQKSKSKFAAERSREHLGAEDVFYDRTFGPRLKYRDHVVKLILYLVRNFRA